MVDRAGDQGDAWRAAAGMLAPQIEAGPDNPLFDFGLAGRERYRELSEELLEATGIDIGLWQEGIARVATSEDEVAELKSHVAWQRQQGHICDWFDEEEARTKWPWLRAAHGALWAPHDGSLDPALLVEALLADATRLGARIVHDSIVSIESRGERVTAAVGKERYPAGDVVIAAGAWSSLITGMPRPLPVVPVRGQMAALPWPADLERSIVYGRHCYLMARGDEALAGSTMEHAGYEPEVTSAGLARIFNAVTELLPSLAQADVHRTWAGLRPVTPDGLPIIGPEPESRGLWYATGHGRNGILLAGITGLLLAQHITADHADDHLAPFRPERFFDW